MLRSLLIVALVIHAVSAHSLRYKRQDDFEDPDACTCVSYHLCEDGYVVEETATRTKQCEGEVDVCCKVRGQGGGIPAQPIEPVTQPPKYPSFPPPPQPPVRPSGPQQPPVRPSGPQQPPVRPSGPQQPPVRPSEPQQPPRPSGPSFPPSQDEILPPLRPRGTGCGLKRIPQGSFGLETENRFSGNQTVPFRTGFGEYPWMVALFRIEPEGNKFVCGGSLIQPDVVLTGAHCLRNSEMGEIQVRAGDWDTQSTSEPIPHQDRRVSRLIPHPDFNQHNLANNVALIILDRPFSLTDSVDTICVPGTNDRYDAYDCLATGWGLNEYGENGKFQKILRKVSLPIVERETCQEQLRKTRLGKHFVLHKSFICAGGKPDEDTCYGDGGGPLVCPKADDPSRFVQVGIVSWGIGCGDNNPGVYASVEYFSNWIAENLPYGGNF